MTENEAKKYMLIEKECINRDCNRDCANCDIVQDVEDLNNAYDVAIQALEKQIPKKIITSPCNTCEKDCVIANVSILLLLIEMIIGVLLATVMEFIFRNMN